MKASWCLFQMKTIVLKPMKYVLALTLFVFSLPILAQNQIDSIVNIPFFTVQGMREADSLLKRNKQAYYMDRQEIENAPVQSINDVLNYATGIDVRTRGPIGAQADLSIRGGSFDQSLVLIDGVKMADPQTGHHLMNLPIALDQLERVEQINNGGSRLFGPYAFSGAVNLVTRRDRESGLRVKLGSGDFGFFNAGLSTALVNDFSSTSINYERRSADGYIPNTDFEMDNYSIVSHVDIGATKVKVNLGQSERRFGAQNFYSALFPDQFEITKLRFGSAQASFGKGNLQVTPRLYYRQHFDEFQLFREGLDYYESRDGLLIRGSDTVPSWYSGPNHHQSIVLGTELNARYKWKYGVSYLGAEHRRESIFSNNLGEPSSELRAYRDVIYTRNASRSNNSLFFEHNAQFKALSISFGALANFHSDFGNKVFPGIDLSYEVLKDLVLSAGVSQNMRFPTYTDLYYNLGGAVGSINLKPEESDNYQVGIEYRKKRFQASAFVFNRRTDNLIDWVRLNGSVITEAANLTAINFSGLELNTSYLFSGNRSSLYLKRIDVRYSWLNADRKSEGFESNYVLDYLRNKLYVAFDHSITKNMGLRWNIRYQEREGGYFDFSKAEEIEYPAFALVDFKLYQRLDKLEAFVEVSNLFDTQYRDIASVLQPGRWLRLGLVFNLNL